MILPAQAKEKAARTYAQEDLDQVFHEFDSGQSGLSSKQAISRLKHFGANTIQKTQQEAQWKIFLKNFTSLMAILLWVSGVIAIVSGTLELGIAIWCVNIINGCFSYYQQHEAQKATDSMLAMLPLIPRFTGIISCSNWTRKILCPGMFSCSRPGMRFQWMPGFCRPRPYKLMSRP
ncbi:cation-transporting ATPase [Agrilactobacillus composti DSM 18527 = JCM 14202]|nr:cation-transporting ATPase [Agrilactobacillus composti DSM 18527 = JCM 14202]